MKNLSSFSLTAILILAITLSGCGGGNSGGDNSGGGDSGGGTTYTPGQQSSAYTVGVVTFYMRFAPSGSFPSDDANVNGGETTDFPTTLTVDKAYWIAETDVTYELWNAVKTWATDTAPNKYYFVNVGRIGSLDTGSEQQPVTYVSWRDAMIWCNALTEYYNAQNGTDYACVYYVNSNYSTPIRSVNKLNTIQTAYGSEDNPYVNPNAKGFRLPTSNEWELAAAYKDGTNWTPGSYASGATKDYNDDTATSAVAVYATTDGSTATVKSKSPNALGLYDMSGNVAQWCFDWYPGSSFARVGRGGVFLGDASFVRLGRVYSLTPISGYVDVGFRPVRTE